jgi:ribosomal protein L31
MAAQSRRQVALREKRISREVDVYVSRECLTYEPPRFFWQTIGGFECEVCYDSRTEHPYYTGRVRSANSRVAN